MYRKATQSRRNLIPILSHTRINWQKNPCPEAHQAAGEPVQDCASEHAEVPALDARDVRAAPELVRETAIQPVRTLVQAAVREHQVLTAVLVQAAVRDDAEEVVQATAAQIAKTAVLRPAAQLAIRLVRGSVSEAPVQ